MVYIDITEEPKKPQSKKKVSNVKCSDKTFLGNVNILAAKENCRPKTTHINLDT